MEIVHWESCIGDAKDVRGGGNSVVGWKLLKKGSLEREEGKRGTSNKQFSGDFEQLLFSIFFFFFFFVS